MDNKCFTPPIIENRPDIRPTTFLTKEVVGVDDTVTPPKNGAAYNMIVKYPLTGHIYMYDSAGLPTLINDMEHSYIPIDTKLSLTSRNPVENRAITDAINMEKASRLQSEYDLNQAIKKEKEDRIAGDAQTQTNIDAVADRYAGDITRLDNNITAETLNRQTEDAKMQLTITQNSSAISAVNAALIQESQDRQAEDQQLNTAVNTINEEITRFDALIEHNHEDIVMEASDRAAADGEIEAKLDKTVVTDVTIDATASTDVVSLNNGKVNIGSGETSSTEIPLPVASEEQAGIVNSSTFQAIANNSANINTILHSSVAVSGIPDNPTQEELTAAYDEATGQTGVVNTARMYDTDHQITWVYYSNTESWYPANAIEVVSELAAFTNATAGTIKGSTTTGQVFAESNGTGSVNGWDALAATANNALSGLALKQDALTEGQLAAVSSGITADKVSTYDGYAAQINAKANSADLAAVATTGSYNSLTDTPAAPGNGKLSIAVNSVEVGSFDANTNENQSVDITVPTSTSQLTNNSNFVSDANYVHTDNNFTTALKNKLDGVEAGAEVNVQADWNASTGDAAILNKPSVPVITMVPASEDPGEGQPLAANHFIAVYDDSE